MSNRWPGGLIRRTPVTPAGPYQNGAAPGVWTLAEAAFWTKQGLWPTAGRAEFVAVAHDSSPFVTAYPWSSSGFGTKFSNPATLPSDRCAGVEFSPSGDVIVAGSQASPFVIAYQWSGAGFGTKFADPATLPAGTGNSVAFNVAGNAIAVAHPTSPFVTAYPWSSSGFGTKFADPATLPDAQCTNVTFTLTP